MNTLRHKKISTTIVASVLMTLLVAMLALVAVLGRSTYAATTAQSEQIAAETVSHYAQKFDAIGSVSYSVANALMPVVSSLSGEEGGREEAIALLEEVVQSNSDVFGLWTAWEPNAFDGKDALYRNQPYHDASGRFVAFAYESGDGVIVEPLTGYDDPVEGFYYSAAKETGEIVVSEPYEDLTQADDMLLYSISIPIYRGEEFVGVFGVDIDMAEMIATMNTGSILETGSLQTLSPGGLVATHRDPDLLLSQYEATAPRELHARFDELFHNGGSFTAEVYSEYAGQKVLCVAQAVQIGDSKENWIVFGTVPMATVTAYARELVSFTALAGFALVVVIGLLIVRVVNKQLCALSRITQAADQLAVGAVEAVQLDPITDSATNNEVELLNRSFSRMVAKTREQVVALQRVADGDLAVEIIPQSDDDTLGHALQHMVSSNRQLLGVITNSSNQVSNGAYQISASSQSLASSVSEQAATVEELSTTMADIRNKSAQSTELCQKVTADIAQAGQLTQHCNENVQQMQRAMEQINERSQTIQSIIKVIDEIAFQTNILALNASVEAARAGVHGQGFAVVANEVRMLASKSAKAVQRTEAVIAESMLSIEEGNQNMATLGGSMESLENIAGGIDKAMTALDEAMARENEMIGSVTVGILQIAEAIQCNSANVQENAASAQEMASQSTLLDSVVARYKLHQTAGDTGPATEEISSVCGAKREPVFRPTYRSKHQEPLPFPITT